MELTPYIERLQEQLAVAADAAGEDARAVADRLIPALDSAAQLALLAALSDAAEEITAELAPGSVDVRLRGLTPEFAVTMPTDGPSNATDDAPAPSPVPPESDGGTARLNLRLAESLKARMETAASADGLSLNAWIVRAVSTALAPTPTSNRTASKQRWTGWAH